jgi:hypothetical protein
MRVQIFKNGKGLIHGADAKRIVCDIEGTLKIGAVEISISPEQESIMPVLFNGTSGVHSATFTSILGNVYELENVTIKGGRIVPPPQTSVELMELRCRTERLEEEFEAMQNELLELKNIFDTNSLNFLIN